MLIMCIVDILNMLMLLINANREREYRDFSLLGSAP